VPTERIVEVIKHVPIVKAESWRLDEPSVGVRWLYRSGITLKWVLTESLRSQIRQKFSSIELSKYNAQLKHPDEHQKSYPPKAVP
jgi:hypothetical protein